MSLKNSSRWHSAELYRRLGIRYVSKDKPENPSISADLTETASTGFAAHPVIEKESVESPASRSPDKSSWITAATDTIQAMELTAFDQDICECQKCPLGATRKHFVFGSGNPQAKVLFIGEAPGADEDEKGLPFVGRAGQLLTKIIESTQTWKRSDVFICNVLKCRPPGNRTPLPEEVEQCRPYLEEQIQIIKPKLIMALGAAAGQALLRSKDPVGKMRNRWHDHNGIPLRVTYHPAALLRFDGYKKDVWQDMKELTAKYRELEGLA
jgi:uracil-DNA glycosylase family 4